MYFPTQSFGSEPQPAGHFFWLMRGRIYDVLLESFASAGMSRTILGRSLCLYIKMCMCSCGCFNNMYVRLCYVQLDVMSRCDVRSTVVQLCTQRVQNLGMHVSCQCVYLHVCHVSRFELLPNCVRYRHLTAVYGEPQHHVFSFFDAEISSMAAIRRSVCSLFLTKSSSMRRAEVRGRMESAHACSCSFFGSGTKHG